MLILKVLYCMISESSIHLLLPTMDQIFNQLIGNINLLKERAYKSRLREVEHSSFIPLVFSATGGMSHEAAVL